MVLFCRANAKCSFVVIAVTDYKLLTMINEQGVFELGDYFPVRDYKDPWIVHILRNRLAKDSEKRHDKDDDSDGVASKEDVMVRWSIFQTMATGCEKFRDDRREVSSNLIFREWVLSVGTAVSSLR